MQIGRHEITIKASRFPWQAGYDWRGMKNSAAPPLNRSGARFGGGWKYKLGFAWSGQTLMLDLLFGIVTVRVFDWKAEEAWKAERKARIDAILKRNSPEVPF